MNSIIIQVVLQPYLLWFSGMLCPDSQLCLPDPPLSRTHVSTIAKLKCLWKHILFQCRFDDTLRQQGFPGHASGKELPVNAGDMRRRFNPCIRKIPWRRKWQPNSVLLPGKSHGQRSLEGLWSIGLQRVGHY